MRIQTQGNSNKVWLSSDEGVINNTMILSAPTLEKILQAVNEKYGTSLEGWSQLPRAYEVGDTVPNWNAYEKIEIVSIYIANITPGFIGRIIEEKAYIYVDNNGNCYATSSEGKILGTGATLGNDFKSYIQNLITNKGYRVSEIDALLQSFEIGYILPNWSEYVII